MLRKVLGYNGEMLVFSVRIDFSEEVENVRKVFLTEDLTFSQSDECLHVGMNFIWGSWSLYSFVGKLKSLSFDKQLLRDVYAQISALYLLV